MYENDPYFAHTRIVKEKNRNWEFGMCKNCVNAEDKGIGEDKLFCQRYKMITFFGRTCKCFKEIKAESKSLCQK